MNTIDRQQLGPRLLIKFLQDAAGKGDLDPWDIDVISVIDSFLEQYSHTSQSSSENSNSYQKDLSETSEAFFAASVLVNLKAQVLESEVFTKACEYCSKKLSITLITSISHGSRSPLPAASWRNLINNLGPNCCLSIELK